MLSKIFGTRIRTLPTRALDMGSLLDTVLICAVGTILVIRTQLWLTNYPQLGGHGLHIAHLLWGGLGMLIALVILLSFLSPVARQVAAVLGGIGFGFFIDELGKFLTSDNNYFFKPTAAIMYVFFVLFFLGIRSLRRRRKFTKKEYLVNAIELTKDAAIRDMDPKERDRALALLAQCEQSDPFVAPLRSMLENARCRHQEDSAFTRLLSRLQDWYFRVIENRWFTRVVTTLMILWALFTVVEIVSLISLLGAHLSGKKSIFIGGAITSKSGHFGVVRWLTLLSSIAAGGLVFVGLYKLRQSRDAGYVWFERALFVSIFLAQVFVFLESQFAACIGFLVDLTLLISIRYMLQRERDLKLGLVPPGGPVASVAPPARAPA
jgi:hypothetical protein